MTGATVVDRVSVLITHLSSLISQNASRLLSREDVRLLTEGLKAVNPSVVDELIPSVLTLGEVQRVLCGLLQEQVPIRDIARIYESLSLKAKQTTNPEQLIEAARMAIAPAITARHARDGIIRVLTIDPVFEQQLLEGLRQGEEGSQILLDPSRLEMFLRSYAALRSKAEETGQTVVLVCAPALRPALYRTVSLQVPHAVVMSYPEVTGAGIRIETVGVVRESETIAA
jgi:flagellar biosynthesis protein FlhA